MTTHSWYEIHNDMYDNAKYKKHISNNNEFNPLYNLCLMKHKIHMKQK